MRKNLSGNLGIKVTWIFLAWIVSCVTGSPQNAFKALKPTDQQLLHGASAPQTVVVPITHFQYNKGEPVKVRMGDSIVWINHDNMPHTATRRAGSGEIGTDFNTGFIQPGKVTAPVKFLKESGPNGFSYSCDVHEGMEGFVIVSGEANPPLAQIETPSIHSMVVMGLNPNAIFLHHIALFHDPNHQYHVTLEVRLVSEEARAAYKKFREADGDAPMTLDPTEFFLLSDLQSGQRKEFKAKFTPDGADTPVAGLEEALVEITRIIQFRKYDPKDLYPDRLTYQLYGNRNEVFLAHQVTEAPSFQQVVKLKSVPSFLTDDLIKSNPLVIIPAKQIAASEPRTVKIAVLNNSTHVLLSPPPNTLNPKEPLKQDEELQVRIGDETEPKSFTVGRMLYFDVRILNK
jgi:plastocyanin